jgi:hypothetical protein
VDTPLLIRQAGLCSEEIADPKARIPARKQVSLLALVADALGDELLGIHLAAAFEPREVGLLYFVLASSGTFGEAVTRVARYVKLANDGVLLHCLRTGGCGLRYTYVGVPRHTDRHQMEFWATIFVRLAAQITGTRISPARVALAHPRCSRSGEVEHILGCRVTYGAKRDEVVFPEHAASLPLVASDPYLNDLLVSYCEEALAHRARPMETLRTRVENVITPRLPHGKARIVEVARALGMSARSLSRGLALDGLTSSTSSGLTWRGFICVTLTSPSPR